MAARKGARKRPAEHRCTAKTKSGRRCKRKRADGLETCPQHADDGASGGRPTKLTEPVADLIVDVLRKGGFMESAAAAASISKATLYAWLERGDPEREGLAADDAPYVEFRDRVEQARAAAELDAVERVVEAGKSDWRAAAWFLERSAPDRWAGPRRSSATRDPSSPSTGAPPRQGPPQLRVVDDLVAADGSTL
jgi:hypothetical protein